MKFKLNCDRCGDPLVKGKIFNFRDECLCEDCYILFYIFSGELPGDTLQNELKQRRRTSPTSVLDLSTKRKALQERMVKYRRSKMGWLTILTGRGKLEV